MSIWTHVAGIIRVDWLRLKDSDSDMNWDLLIGKEARWEDPDEVWDDYYKNPWEFMPCGSEGSLRKVIWENPDKSSLASYTVSIFGDLRDYGDLEKIKEWFAEVCGRLMVRNAIITAECEAGKRFSAVWDEDKGNFDVAFWEPSSIIQKPKESKE